MALSTYLGNKLLDHVLRNTAYTQPATVYLALHTANPTPAGNGAEKSGDGYARQTVTFDAAASRATQNSALVTFTPTGTAGTITHWAIWDASTAGNMLHFGVLNASSAWENGVPITVPAGNLDINMVGVDP